MAFPEEAVYGDLDPNSLRQWDGRDDTPSSAPLTPNSRTNNSTATTTSSSSSDNDDNCCCSTDEEDNDGYEDLVHIASRDDEGNPCHEIEVTRSITSFGGCPTKSLGSMLSPSNNNNVDQQLSPHIDTTTNNNTQTRFQFYEPEMLNQIIKDAQQEHQHDHDHPSSLPPILPLSPCTSETSNNTTSHNSISTELSNLEYKMTHEVNTVKDWVHKLKLDRDKYKDERDVLVQQLQREDERRVTEVEGVRKELEGVSLGREKAEEQIVLLLEELQTCKAAAVGAAAVSTSTAVGGPGNNSTNTADLQKQLEIVKAKLTLAEEALDNEKSSSSLRTATKLEQVRQAHFEELKTHITDMEQKFKIDLAQVRNQKEEEVQSLEEELITARGVQEHLASQIDNVNDELSKLKEEHMQLSMEHEHCPTSKMMEEAVLQVKIDLTAQHTEALGKVETKMAGLVSQLEAKDMELIQVKGEYTNEHDRMKDQISNLSKLVDTKSTDLEQTHEKMSQLQKELCTSKMETTKAIEENTQLSDENFKLKQEVEMLNQREHERKSEVMRLHKKLEEIHSLVPSQSDEDDEEVMIAKSIAAAKVAAEGVVTAVPDLTSGGGGDDEDETVVSVVEETSYDVTNELEATRKKLVASECERERLKNELESMKEFPPFTAASSTSATTQQSEMKSDVANAVAVLEEKLVRAEKLYVDVAVENNELKAKLGSPRNNKKVDDSTPTTTANESMASELKSMKATLLIKNAEIATLKRRLLLKENIEQSAEEQSKGTTAEVVVVTEPNNQEQDANQQMYEDEAPADVPGGILLGNDIDELKEEHRKAVKLLMEKHASLKTQVRLLMKEKEGLERAYEVEQACSAELESSLQELVALLEAERSMHSGKMNELKHVKHKFSKLKKRRVPVDAAYKASLMLLEQLESKKIPSPRAASRNIKEVEKVMKAAVDSINTLTEAIEKEDNSDLSLGSLSLPDDEHTKALSQACEKLELAMYTVKMQLSTKTIEYDDLLKAKTNDDKMNQEVVKDLKEQLSVLTQSTAAYEETVANYKNLIGEAKDENDSLKKKLDAVKEEYVTQSDGKELASTIAAEVAQKEKEALMKQLQEAQILCQVLEAENAELDELRTTVNLLQEEKSGNVDWAQKCASLESDKTKLINEIDKAKESFEGVIAEFEQTLTETCAANENALREKQEECKSLTEELDRLKKELSDSKEASLQEIARLTEDSQEFDANSLRKLEESQLADAIKHDVIQQENAKLKQQFQDAETRCQTLAEEKDKLVADLSKAKESFEQVIAEFEQELITTCEANEKSLSEKREECKELSQKLESLERVLDASKQEVARLTGISDSTHSTKNELEETLHDLEESQLATQHDNESLKQQLHDTKAKCQTLQEEKEKLIGEVSRAKDSFEQVIVEFEEELKAKTAASEQALRESQEECKEIKEQLDRLKDELSDSKETSLQEITRLTEITSADKASIEELQKELEHSKEEVTRLSELVKDLEKSVEDLREELADSEESERAQQEVVAIHEASIESLKTELSQANTKVEELLKFIDQVEASTSESQGKMGEVKEELEDTKKSLKESVEVCMQLRMEIAEKDALASSLSKAKSDLENEAANHDQAISMIEHELETIKSEITLKNKQVQVAQEEKERTKQELDNAIQSMEEVVESLQKQIKVVESEKELNRSMYEKDIQLQQQEVETIQKKHAAAMADLDSLSDLISSLKTALESEKENGKILLAQFTESEEDRKAQAKQKAQLEKELAASMESIDELSEQIRCLESDLAVAITEEEECELKEKISLQEEELNELRAKLDSIQTSRNNLQDEFKSTLHSKEEEATKLRIILQEANDKLSRLHTENEMLRKENSEAVSSMSTMLNDAVRGRADADMSLQDSIHNLEKQRRLDIKKNSQISKLEHELQILRTKERYQESMIASLKNQIKRGS
jgi:chromosome segregation ATPase